MIDYFLKFDSSESALAFGEGIGHNTNELGVMSRSEGTIEMPPEATSLTVWMPVETEAKP